MSRIISRIETDGTGGGTTTAHAATHQKGATDEVTLEISQLVDFPTTMTPSAHTHAKADLTDATATPTASKIPIADANGKLDGWVTGGGTPSAHAASHIRGASDEIDGDKLDIDWNPSNYTPTTVTEADNADHLAAHLKGIDTALGSVTASNSVTIIAGEALSQYDVVYLHTDGKCYKAANNSTKAVAEVYAIVTQSGGISAEGTGTALRQGDVSGSWPFASGGLTVYLSSTAGAITTTEPTTPGTYWVPLGETTHTSHIYFSPSTGVLIGTASGAPILTGTMAARPTAGVSGRIYLPTDGYPMSFDNGGGWDTYVNGFRCKAPPVVGSLTGINTDANSTLTADGDGLMIKLMGSNSSSFKAYGWLTALPAAPYTFTVGLRIIYLYPQNWSGVGICLSDGTNASTSKWTTIQRAYGSSPLWMSADKYTNSNSYTASYFQAENRNLPWTETIIWLQIHDNNTTRYYRGSSDGVVFFDLHSVSRTDFLTPTHCGVFLAQGTNSIATTITRAQARIFHWSLA